LSTANAPGDVVLRASDLVKVYPPAVRALAGVGIELRAGEIRGLLGANGAGKSSLIKILSGVETPTSGTIWNRDAGDVAFDGPSAARLAGIGVVHQELPLFPNLTAAENVALGQQAGGFLTPRRRREVNAAYERIAASFPGAPAADTMLEHVGLQGWQLTAIIRARMTNARVLILDEPTSSLNPDERRILHRNLREVARDGTAILYVSHFLDDVLDVCDVVTVLRDGKVVMARETADLSEDQLLYAMVGETKQARRDAAGRDGGTEPGLSVRGLRTAGVGPIDLDVPLRSCVGLYGLEDAGCSEVLHVVYGLTAGSGAVSWRGRPLAGDTRARIEEGLGFVSGDRPRTLIGDWLVAMNYSLIDIGSRPFAASLDRAGERAKAAASIRDLQIKATPDQPLRTLSGGNQQKVALGRWLDRRGICVLADEPTRGVDVRGRSAIHEALIALSAAGNSVLVRSTDPEELVELCDRVLVMVDGKVTRTLAGDDLTTEQIEAATRTKVRAKVMAGA
jgi:ABC-type sugar transport system ATPase subunit